MSDYNWLNNNPSGPDEDGSGSQPPLLEEPAPREGSIPTPVDRETAQNDRGYYNYSPGTPPEHPDQGSPYPGGSPYQETGSPGLATAALILGICSLIFICCGVGFILGALGIILALLSRGAGRMSTGAKTGLGLSIAGTVLSIFFFVAALAFSLSDGSFRRYMEEYYNEYYEDYYEDYYDDYFDNFEEPFDDYEDYFDNYGQDYGSFEEYFSEYLSTSLT